MLNKCTVEPSCIFIPSVNSCSHIEHQNFVLLFLEGHDSLRILLCLDLA